jgi:quercetin dioxygenase-like cupin family protein
MMRIGRQFTSTTAICAVAAFLASGCMFAYGAQDEARVTSLAQRAFPDLPGKEGMVLMVEFPPGHVDPPHRHDAHVFVYVLSGSIEMQVAGGAPVALKAGDTFYENPQDVHAVGRNLSKTESAKLIVFFVKNQNTPPVLPATRN